MEEMNFLKTLTDAELERATQLMITKLKEHCEKSIERWVREKIEFDLNKTEDQWPLSYHDTLIFRLNLDISLAEVFSRLGISCDGGGKK